MKLREKMRPVTFEDVVGQQHLTGKKSVLRNLIDKGSFDALMFVGPPGTGKTTVAEMIGDELSLPFYRLHASSSGTGDVKKIVDAALSAGRQVLLFIDEIHRFNKAQQDLLLRVIDEGSAKLIGASTENPSHNLIAPLRSRSFIFTFRSLGGQDLYKLMERALGHFRETYGVSEVVVPDGLFDELKADAAGDGRRFLNLLEITAMLGDKEGDVLTLSRDGMDEIARKTTYDTDEHYDLLSAMIKSIRGSDPDAALVWALKLIDYGVDAETVFRRLLISASEDIGNAFPDALVFANNAYQSFQAVGYPEGMIILSHLVTFLASCPKSNRSYMALHRVRRFLEENDPKVPEQIRHHTKTYRYPFDHGEFVRQTYLKEGEQFYFPSGVGFEAKIRERMKRLWDGAKKYDEE